MSKRKQASSKEVENDQDIEYDSKTYWDNRYVESNGHEWYYSFELLEPLFLSALSETFNGNVLEIGCGDKPLIDSFAARFTGSTCVGIDYSQNVIDLLNKTKKHDRISYKQMDARRTNFVSDSMDFIVDKGTMDAMLSARDVEQGFANVSRIFKEVVRIMKTESKFMIVSHIEAESCEFDDLMQGAILPALDTKRNVLWDIEAHVVRHSNVKQNQPESSSSGASKKKAKTSNNEEDDEDDEESSVGDGRGTVYIITSKTRKCTRNMLQSGAPVGFKVMEYDSDSEEDEEEEEE